MGFYIERLADDRKIPSKDSADFILQNVDGAYQVYPPPEKWEEDLVCVIENEHWDATAYVFSQSELVRFQPRRDDPRRRSWIHFPGASDLCPFGVAARMEEAER